MNTTQYAKYLDLLWLEYPGNGAAVAIRKYILDCKNGKYGTEIAKTASRIESDL